MRVYRNTILYRPGWVCGPVELRLFRVKFHQEPLYHPLINRRPQGLNVD